MGTTPVCALLIPDVRKAQVSRSRASFTGQLTQREHVAHRRPRASNFDRVMCSLVGDCDERVIAIADVVSVCDIEDQPSSWEAYGCRKPKSLSPIGSPTESTKSLTKPANVKGVKLLDHNDYTVTGHIATRTVLNAYRDHGGCSRCPRE